MAQAADFIQCVNLRLPYIFNVFLQLFIIRGNDELLNGKFIEAILALIATDQIIAP